ncbi:MAG: hypothetical protein RIM80_19285, partial [Alphaproteobacteria bacterium]
MPAITQLSTLEYWKASTFSSQPVNASAETLKPIAASVTLPDRLRRRTAVIPSILPLLPEDRFRLYCYMGTGARGRQR